MTLQLTTSLMTLVTAMSLLAVSTPATAQIPTAPTQRGASASKESIVQERVLTCEGSTDDKHECIAIELKIADMELNNIFQSHLAQLKKNATDPDPTLRQDAREMERRLRNAQAAWRTFRNAECSLQSVEMLGGVGGEALVYYDCLRAKTQERVKQLQKYSF